MAAHSLSCLAPASRPGCFHSEYSLPKRNYGFEKRQKELVKQRQKEEKKQRKLERAKEPAMEASVEDPGSERGAIQELE